MKRILSFIMAAMMVVMMLPAVVSADTTYVAAIGETKYETLVAAVAAAEDGDTIKLLCDASGAGIKIRNKKFVNGITIDFNGHTYTVGGPAVGSKGTETQAFQIHWSSNKADPINVTLKNGTIKADNSLITEGKRILWLVNNYADLTLIDMVLDGTGLYENGENYVNNVLNVNNGDVVIEGETDIIASEGDIAVATSSDASREYTGNVTVKTTGKIVGDVVREGDESTLVIENGIFSDADAVEYLSEELVDEHMTLVQGADGLYSIQCGHSFTEWEQVGFKNVRECEYCGKGETKALSKAQAAVESIKGYMIGRSRTPYAVAIDADETVVISNNTSKNRTIKDLGDSALYYFLADVKYSFEAAEGYEIVAVYVDGVEVKDPADVKIFQIKANHVIKVVTEAVEADEAAE